VDGKTPEPSIVHRPPSTDKKMKLLQTLTFLLLTCSVFAQDYHYSQQYAIPMMLNPSMTGYSSCDARVSLQYRNQWASVSDAFQTTSAAYEHKTFQNNQIVNGFAGVGLTLFNDQSGSGYLRQTSAALSGAYHFFLNDDNQFISIGGQFGVGQQAVKGPFTYDAQFDGQTFSYALPSGEAALSANKLYFDGAAGISYTLMTSAMVLNLGGALFHLSEPDVSLVEGEINLLPRRAVLHGNIEFPVNQDISIIGRMVYQHQSNFNMTNMGGFIKFNLSAGRQPVFRTNDSFIYGGLMYRWDDAAVAIMKFQFGQVAIGASYDFTTSEFTAASRAQGGFELVLNYNFGECGGTGQSCPTF
jgi:type IX secretion system PorP/SprF family membrane protein